MKYKKYRELEEELVRDAIKNARPDSPSFVFHFYHSSSKGRNTSEITKKLSPEELMSIWTDAEAYTPVV